MAKKSRNKKTAYTRSTFVDKQYGYTFTTAYHTKGSYRPHKTAWSISDADAHVLFRKAYIHEISHCRDGVIGQVDKDYTWMNDNLNGLCSLSTIPDPKTGWPMIQPVGSNNEPFAFFPIVRNPTDNWHGYPENTNIIQPRLLKYWLDKGIISDRDYIDIRRNRLRI